MDKREIIIKKIRDFKKELSKEIPISKIILFGSYAKGKTHKWSDLDILIVSQKFSGKKSFKRARGLSKFWNLNKPVDFLCYTPEEFSSLKNTSFVKEIISEGFEV